MKPGVQSLCIGLILCGVLKGVHGQADFSTNQLTSSALTEPEQRALFSQPNNSFLLPVTDGIPAGNIADNAAVRLLQADKSAFPFLATLPEQGVSSFIAVLKPCGMINVHSHMANEMYVVISGQMTGGIAQEVGAAQNTTFVIQPGQIMLVPQGLWHYNLNSNCSPVALIINYDSADPGLVSVNAALSGLSAANPEAAAGNFAATPDPLAPFALDQACLQRCNLPSTGAPGTGLQGLSQELQNFVGSA